MHIEEVAQLTLDLSKRCAEDTLPRQLSHVGRRLAAIDAERCTAYEFPLIQ
jgi:hypothetical protein